MKNQNEHQHHSAHEKNPSQEHDAPHEGHGLRSDPLEHKKDQMTQPGENPGEGGDTHHQHANYIHPRPDQDNPEEQAEQALQSEPEQAHGAAHGVETAMMMDEAHHEHVHSHHAQLPVQDTGHAMTMEHSGHDAHAGHGVSHMGHEQMFCSASGFHCYCRSQ